MNKFYEAVIPSNADHPNGRKTLRTYIAAETKAEAKVKASRFLFQQDGEYGSFYKAPRLEEITEELYISKTEKQLDHVDEWTIKQYCALLSLFGEDETLADIKSAALCLYRGGEVGAENMHKSDDDKTRDWPDLELDIARALWEGELHWEAIPSEVEQWARKKVKRRDVEMMRWFLALREVTDILSRSREFIFKVIRTPHDPEIYLTPKAIDAYVASFVEPEAVDEVPWSEESTDEIAEAPLALERDAQRLAKFLAPAAVDLPERPDADDEWVPGLPEDEPETTVASETADAEASESDIQYSPETDMPAFLRDLKPINGTAEDGRLFATVDVLNARLAAIPAGGSLVLWGLDNGLYHAADGYSSTQIRPANRGGIAALDWYQNAPRKPEKSPALALGTALHAAILEPERFATEYACAPSVNLRTNEGKERLAAFEEDCAERGMTPLKQEDFDTVCLMRDSALAYPTVALLLENGVAELSLFWRMENGLLLKVRPDWLGEFAGAPFLLDIKTTDDVLDFGKSVEKFGYHLQAAFYEFVIREGLWSGRGFRVLRD